MMKKILRRIVEFDAHHRVAVALAVAVLTFGLLFRLPEWSVRLIIAWDAFAICSLALAWTGMFFLTARTRAHEAHLQDSSRAAICGCVVFAAVAGLLSAALLLGPDTEGDSVRHVPLAVLTVVASWLLVHTMLALHYAHICYHIAGTNHQQPCGLIFPNEQQPDFLDFSYFSFVIGMTCQVSDVQIASRRIRRLALWHGLLSFGFNTVILAFTVNLASSLLGSGSGGK